MSVIGTHSRSLASGVSANRKKGVGVADIRIGWNSPGGFRKMNLDEISATLFLRPPQPIPFGPRAPA